MDRRLIFPVSLVFFGIVLWYYGGYSGLQVYANLGISSIIIGLLTLSMDNESSKLLKSTCEAFCEILDSFNENSFPLLIVIPPYENLPKGGLLFVSSTEDVSLGILRAKTGRISLRYSEGYLITPVPGWGLFEEATKEVVSEDPYSGLSNFLAAEGVSSLRLFDNGDGSYVLFVKPLCLPKFFDPVVSASLLSLAVSMDSLLEVFDVDYTGEFLTLHFKPLGGVEEWA